jgi:NAD(P)-dependent dehydrogenase (short-subunit alcohol dehydrogenase family)
MSETKNSSLRLTGKVAVITGASGGIGEASAKLFLAEGASVMLIGRSAGKLKQTLARLGASNKLAYFVADAADEAATQAAISETISVFGGIDILFANAGNEGQIGAIESQSMSNFEEVLRTNVIGVWLAMKHCVAPMKARGGGAMLATASISGVVGAAGGAPYIASKHAVCGLVKSAALELGSANIRVNAIAPGPIDNRMIHDIVAQVAPDNPDALHADMKSRIAMRRYGTNEEVAKLALFLVSDDASYCTGSIHMIDGGITAA